MSKPHRIATCVACSDSTFEKQAQCDDGAIECLCVYTFSDLEIVRK